METIIITAEDAGQRLDLFLASRYPAMSRSKLQKQIKGGAVRLGGKQVTPHIALREGDEVTVPTEAVTPQTMTLEPRPDIALDIVHEDADVIVLNKPAGLLMHPAAGEQDTLANALLAHHPDIIKVGDEPAERPGIVHRLDKDASGLLVVAKTPVAFERLKEQFQAHTVLKEYTVLVGGGVPQDEDTIRLYIGRATVGGRMAARSKPLDGDREAVTHYHRDAIYEKATLLTVRTETGRTHQIRVHLFALGAPVVGDSLYGIKSRFYLAAPRLFLHCSRLGFTHPTSGETMTFTVPLPPALQKFLDAQTLV
jgi:23S rRNA pseudouridine1911/1915/1917 synthase